MLEKKKKCSFSFFLFSFPVCLNLFRFDKKKNKKNDLEVHTVLSVICETHQYTVCHTSATVASGLFSIVSSFFCHHFHFIPMHVHVHTCMHACTLCVCLSVHSHTFAGPCTYIHRVKWEFTAWFSSVCITRVWFFFFPHTPLQT